MICRIVSRSASPAGTASSAARAQLLPDAAVGDAGAVRIPDRQSLPLDDLVCWEPACGEMHMARPLEEYFADVIASDVHRYGDDHELFDFTLAALVGPPRSAEQPDFVITNPPFTLAVEFIAARRRRANADSRCWCAAPSSRAASGTGELWSTNPPSFVLQFCERVVMLEGRLVRAGDVDPFAEEEGRKATTATSYVWLVWLEGEPDTRFPVDRLLTGRHAARGWSGARRLSRAAIRAAQDWPHHSNAVAALATELGVAKGEAWHRVIAAGIDILGREG
jgi:hypothetical protein